MSRVSFGLRLESEEKGVESGGVCFVKIWTSPGVSGPSGVYFWSGCLHFTEWFPGYVSPSHRLGPLVRVQNTGGPVVEQVRWSKKTGRDRD